MFLSSARKTKLASIWHPRLTTHCPFPTPLFGPLHQPRSSPNATFGLLTIWSRFVKETGWFLGRFRFTLLYRPEPGSLWGHSSGLTCHPLPYPDPTFPLPTLLVALHDLRYQGFNLCMSHVCPWEVLPPTNGWLLNTFLTLQCPWSHIAVVLTLGFPCRFQGSSCTSFFSPSFPLQCRLAILWFDVSVGRLGVVRSWEVVMVSSVPHLGR